MKLTGGQVRGSSATNHELCARQLSLRWLRSAFNKMVAVRHDRDALTLDGVEFRGVHEPVFGIRGVQKSSGAARSRAQLLRSEHG